MLKEGRATDWKRTCINMTLYASQPSAEEEGERQLVLYSLKQPQIATGEEA